MHFVMRNLKGATKQTKAHAYLCLIRPTLEYCSGIWTPHTSLLAEQINKVQKKAARYVINNHRRWSSRLQRPEVSITDTINNLKWEDLEVRRNRVALRYLYKSQTNNPAWADLSTLTRKASYYGRTDHLYKLQLPRYLTNTGLHSLLGRTIRQWNNLPLNDFNTFPDATQMKEILDNVDNTLT